MLTLLYNTFQEFHVHHYDEKLAEIVIMKKNEGPQPLVNRRAKQAQTPPHTNSRDHLNPLEHLETMAKQEQVASSWWK